MHLLFDWGDTIMRDSTEFSGAMCFWPRVDLVPGADCALEALSSSHICCMASNAGESDAELMGRALERVGVRQHFRHLWTSKELGAAKPAPAFFLEAAARLGVAPAQCIMIGNDYAKDIAGAKAAGMRTVWLNPSAAEAPGDAADRIIRSMEELPAVIAGLVG